MEDENLPLVSIIVRSMDRPSLSQALDSLALQTYPYTEIIVVNANGKEHPDLGECCGHFPLRLINTSGEPLLRSKAANAGLAACNGKHIGFLDDDDTLEPEHVRQLVSSLNSTDGECACYSAVQVADRNDPGGKCKMIFAEPKVDFVKLLLGNVIPIHAVLFPASILEQGVCFDESLDLYEDWDFWLQMSRLIKFVFVDKISATYYSGGSSAVGGCTNGVDETLVQQSTISLLSKWLTKLTANEFAEIRKRYHQVQYRLGTVRHELSQAVVERDLQLEELTETINESTYEIGELTQAIFDREKQIDVLTHTANDHAGQVGELTQTVNEQNIKISELIHEKILVYGSWSWKLTAPLRIVKAWLVNIYKQMRKMVSDVSRFIWYRTPFYFRIKRALKNRLFILTPFLFRHTLAFKSWQSFTKNQDEVPIFPGEQINHDTSTLGELPVFVPLLKTKPLTNIPVQLIAFYLPQFHPINENNMWWGEGFTEWTNVRSAKPQFPGHYQPHVPSDLGYYDLRDVSVMRRQMELAAFYGLGGFCFYFYWFAGKRLLETPTLQYLENKDINFPFCICWANENWTRRWDGLDNDILIGQEHSEADDFAFIKYVSRYLKDERYIRIQGKPLLLVYRPSSLPSAKKTAYRWRMWCRNHGIGEIYLAYTQSFETVDPRIYGFDAAIEFPPNNSVPPDLTAKVKPLQENFGGTVYDWSVFPERSQHYDQPSYKLYRGVNPSWDNTARRKNNGIIFTNSSPCGYQEWLLNAQIDTLNRHNNVSEQIIFINAWNEWAEGAYLEPDQRAGYAYLEATRMSVIRTSILTTNRLNKEVNSAKDTMRIAVIVHAYYIDIFEDILVHIKKINFDFKLFVTTTAENIEKVKTLLKSTDVDSFVLNVENHGRDILPFLKIIELVKSDGFDFFLKLHTKKSKHREDGDIWRNELYSDLLLPSNMLLIFNRFSRNAGIGMIGPVGHIVPMKTYFGANKKRVIDLASRMGVNEKDVMSIPFIAGSMFYGRVSALLPLLNIAFKEDDFEPETGQVDGTLAHAIERLFAVSVFSAGMNIVSTGDLIDKNPEEKITENYAFADKSFF